MMYTHAAAGIAGAVLAGVLAWQVQAWRYDAQIAGLKAQHAAESAKAQADVRAQELAFNQKLQDALNDARKRENKLRADADAARRNADSLRNQLNDATRRIVDAPPDAVAEYATTGNELFADCSRRYQELAGKADGHAADVRTLVQAWPGVNQ